MGDDAELDPQVVRMLQAVAHLSTGAYEDLGPEAAREAHDLVAELRRRKYGEEPVKSVVDRTIAGPAGALPARIYWPDAPTPAPVVLFLHGGGWTIGNIASYDGVVRTVCNRTGAIIVSLDYRLAPEHPYPAAFDDARAALDWTVAHAEELGGDPGRVGVMGDSAGGNLGAALTLLARDHGGPPIKAQCLVYPSVDATTVYPSFLRYAEGYLLTAGMSRWFGDNYFPDLARRFEPYASPLLAVSHAGLPPAVVAVPSHDVLRDQGEAYARTLAEAGVPVWHRTYAGLVHGFLMHGVLVDAAQAAVDEICAAFRELLDA